MVERMFRRFNIYIVTMVILGGLLATSVVMKVDGDTGTHVSSPVMASTTHTQIYVSKHHDTKANSTHDLAGSH